MGNEDGELYYSNQGLLPILDSYLLLLEIKFNVLIHPRCPFLFHLHFTLIEEDEYISNLFCH